MGDYEKRIASIIGLVIVLLSIGTAFYHNLEGWSYVDSLYFSTTTLTTVGYGDLTPTHNISKLFTVVFILVGVGIIFASITIIGTHYIEVHLPASQKVIVERLNNNFLKKILNKANREDIINGFNDINFSRKKKAKK